MARAANLKAENKPAFEYDFAIKTGKTAPVVHDALNSAAMKGGARESRDSDAHPATTAVAVGFDVTGSMHSVPVTVQKKLCTLLGLLLRKSYLTDPAILVAGIGDATTDTAPCQIGQFESGNEIDADLAKIWLESGGGGQKTESYELFLYFLARKTKTDCFEKRGKRGYAFIIGDEMAYSRVKANEVKTWFGDDLESDIPVAQILKEAQEKWDIYFILPNLTSYYNDPEVSESWRDLLGQQFMKLDDPEGVAELIATVIGLAEDSVDRDTAAEHLKEAGAGTALVAAVTGALATVGKGGSDLSGTGLSAV